MTNELIDAILRIVNVNAHTTLARGSISVAVVRNMLVEAGCIALCGDTDYTRREDYVEPSGCTDCGRHGEWGHLGLCHDCKAATNYYDCAACGGLSSNLNENHVCSNCSGDAECLDDIQDADFADNPDHTVYVKDTSRASFDDHEVCIGCGELTTCDEDYLCCRCGG